MSRFTYICAAGLLQATTLFAGSVITETEFSQLDSVPVTNTISATKQLASKDRFLDIRENPFSKSKLLLPVEPVEPTGLVFRPDASLVAQNGSVFHLSSEHQSIFRWSPMLGIYTQSMPLSATPNFMTYYSTDNLIYLSYDDGLMTVVDPDTGLEYEFVRLEHEVIAMSLVDSQVFVVTDTGTEILQYVIGRDGNVVSELVTDFRSDDYFWNQALRKLFYVTNNIMPNQLLSQSIDAIGNIGVAIVAGNESINPVIAPVVTGSSSTSVVLGTGDIYDASSFEFLTSLDTEVTDAAWYSEDRLLTLTQSAETLAIREWTSTREVSKEIIIPTEYAALIPGEEDFVYLLWLDQGMPKVMLWNFGLDDSDSDGVIDSSDAFPIDASESSDNDGDGIGDNRDPDDDNDEILDVNDIDDDNDGYNDNNDVFPSDSTEWSDSDNDGIGDNADTDDDNDGVHDDDDAFPFDPEESVDTDNDGIGNNADTDDDNDGVLDVDDAFTLDDSESLETDMDGIGNNADPDDDGDGVNDEDDTFPFDDSEFVDTDMDGTGNNADSDDDNDGINDEEDEFPLIDNESLDTDNDGIGDNADTDDDNDGVLDVDDAFPLDDSESVDTDMDGIGNNADTDDDNDGINDEDDEFPLVANEFIDTTTMTDIDFDGTPLLPFGVSASSYEDNRRFTLPAPGAIDGDLTTRWGSEFVENAWISIDLGTEQQINRVVLNWEVAYGEIYEIQVSNDSSNWTTVARVSESNGEIDNLEFAETSGRYVRMLGIKRGTQWGYSLWEFRVFGPELNP